jgi:CO/xanthine dehydrogenase FAD-binding subunit
MARTRGLKPAALIDLNRCPELVYIRREGDWLAVGGMVRQFDAMDSELVRAHCPLVSLALEHAGPVAVRCRATVGGTIAHADRVAELPAVAAALDAVMVIDGIHGRRSVAAADFFVGDLSTAIAPGEFLREVRFPVCAPGAYAAFQEVSVRQEGVAVVGLAAYVPAALEGMALAAMGVDGVPVRLRQTEALVRERGLGAAGLLDAAMACARAEIEPAADPYATAAYRRHTVGVLVQRALQALDKGKA